MSLHIESTEEVRLKLDLQRKRTLAGAIAVTTLGVTLMAVLFYLLKIFIPVPEEVDIIAYTSPDNAPPTVEPPTPKVTQRPASNTASAVNVKVIVAADAAADVAMAKVDIDMPDIPVEPEIGNMEGIGAGFGNDLGNDVSCFGGREPSGSTLVGTFYDSKQTSKGEPSGMSYSQYKQFLKKFVTEGWKESDLRDFYKAPRKLYAAQFYVPRTPAQEAPKAFGCEDTVKPGQWLVIYRGKVKAPKSGTFRFVGMGDDFMAVRFNKKNVLDYGWESITLGEMMGNKKNWQNAMEDKPGYEAEKRRLKEIGIMVPPVALYRYKNSGHWNNALGGLAAGKTFTVKQGEVYPIEILVSEGPGGEFGMTLLLEEVGLPPIMTDGSTGAPILPLFRTNYGVPQPDKSKEYVPFDEIGPVWESVVR